MLCCAAALGLVGAADVGGRVDLLQLLGHFVAAGGHLFGADFSRLTISSQQLVAFGGLLGTLGSVLRASARRAAPGLRRNTVSIRVPGPASRAINCCLAASNFSSDVDIAARDQVDLPPAEFAQLQQHLVLPADQLGESFGRSHSL